MSPSRARERRSQKLIFWTAATGGFLFAITPAHTLVGVPSWIAYALLVPCIAIFIYLSRGIDRDKRAQISAVIADRPAPTPEEFGTSYFSGEAAHLATRCRRSFGEFYRFDSSRIHPTRNSRQNCGSRLRIVWSADEFLMAIEEEFGVTFSSGEARRLLTMRDITEAVLPNSTMRPNRSMQQTGSARHGICSPQTRRAAPYERTIYKSLTTWAASRLTP